MRSRLERAMRATDPDAAAALKRRRRPHLAAWACNQLARTAPDDVAEFLAATDDVVEAQRGALDGGDPDELRAAGRHRQELIDELAGAAVGLLGGHAPKPVQYRDPIATTLDAASLDADLADDLVRGRLTQPLNPPAGFGPMVDVTPRPRVVRDEKAATRGPSKGGPSKREVGQAERDATRAQEEAVRAAEAVSEAEARVASAELSINDARAHLADVERARERAKESLANARAAVEQSKEELDDARRAARETNASAAKASTALADLRGGD